MGAVGVCGFGRCGSTMMMQMLAAGGLPPVEGSKAGSYELEDVRAAKWPQVEGHAVKLLDSVLYYGVPSGGSWSFIWLDRDPMQQALSQVKFLSLVAEVPPSAVSAFAESYRRDRPRALAALEAAGKIHIFSYEQILAHPMQAALRLRQQISVDLDVTAAAAVVHERDGLCRPDLKVEIAASWRPGRARRRDAS